MQSDGNLGDPYKDLRMNTSELRPSTGQLHVDKGPLASSICRPRDRAEKVAEVLDSSKAAGRVAGWSCLAGACERTREFLGPADP